MVNLYNMIGMKLNSHPAANLVSAKRIIVQHSDVKLWSNLCDLNPHPLDVRLITELYPKNQLGKVAGLQTLSPLLRWNLERVRKLSVSRCTVIKSVSNSHGANVA
jgi:hypothetical protein